MSDEPGTEDLERRINELEATVDGLTDELVDRTERIRALEAELGVVAGDSQAIITAGQSEGATDGGTDGGSASADASGEGTAAATTDEPESSADVGDGILVPEPEGQTTEEEIADAGPENAANGAGGGDAADGATGGSDVVDADAETVNGADEQSQETADATDDAGSDIIVG